MKNAQKYLKQKDIRARISFKDGKQHTVILRESEVDTIHSDGEEIEGVRFVVEEEGDEKSFFTSSIKLIQELASKEEGDVVEIQMKSKKSESGNWFSTYEVKSVGNSKQPDDDIPVIQDTETDTDSNADLDRASDDPL